jgi:diguanylate cyclase (GGDEF)-like protein
MHIIIAVFGTADATFILLHFLGIVHMCITLSAFHIIAALSLLATIVSGLERFRNMSQQQRVMNLGLLILLAFGAIDLVRFNLQKYFFPNVPILSESYLPVGAVVFIMFLLVGYLMYLYDLMKKETERQTLTHLAYRDPMTGLYNRASIIDIFQQALDVKEDVTLLLFDVNGLKHTNDSMGHAMGDELIVAFSKCLSKAFERIGTGARIGGDEFVMLVSGERRKKIESALATFAELEQSASKEIGFAIRAAYGMAGSDEVSEKTTDEVYRLADARMYAMKQRMKEEGVSDFRE